MEVQWAGTETQGARRCRTTRCTPAKQDVIQISSLHVPSLMDLHLLRSDAFPQGEERSREATSFSCSCSCVLLESITADQTFRINSLNTGLPYLRITNQSALVVDCIEDWLRRFTSQKINIGRGRAFIKNVAPSQEFPCVWPKRCVG